MRNTTNLLHKALQKLNANLTVDEIITQIKNKEEKEKRKTKFSSTNHHN